MIKNAGVSIASASHPLYPHTITHIQQLLIGQFQSHLRPIHSIHNPHRPHSCFVRYVSIASASHPLYPQRGASRGSGSGFRLHFARHVVSFPHFSSVCLPLEGYRTYLAFFQSALGALRGSFVGFARHRAWDFHHCTPRSSLRHCTPRSSLRRGIPPLTLPQKATCISAILSYSRLLSLMTA